MAMVRLYHILVLVAVCAAPQTLVGAAPGWWQTKKVYRYENGTPVAALDYAAANQGQLKHVAIAAYEHLVEVLAVHGRKIWEQWDGSISTEGEALCAQIQLWVKVDRGPGTGNSGRVLRWNPDTSTYTVNGTGPMERTVGPTGATSHQDFRAMTQGQLKAVGKVFYRRLDEIYRIQNGTVQLPLPAPWRGGVPWTDDNLTETSEDTADDQNHAFASAGQLKSVFAFDLSGDSNVDGRNDINSITEGLNPFGPPDRDGDGLTNQEEALLGTNPDVKDNPAVQLSVVGFVRP